MKRFILLLALTAAAATAGCGLFTSDAEVNVATLETKLQAERDARAKEDAARKVKDAADAERHGTAAAYTLGADEAADHLPDIPEVSPAKTAVKSDLKVAIKSQDAPDPVKLAEVRLANNLYLQGRNAEADALNDKAISRAIEAEKKSAAAAALIAKAEAESIRKIAESDAALTKTKADAAASLAAKDAELDRKLKEKDAEQRRAFADKDKEIADAKANGPLIAQMALSADYRMGAKIVGGLFLLAVLVTAIAKFPQVGVLICSALFGTASLLGVMSVGVMDPFYRKVAIGVAVVFAIGMGAGVAYVMWRKAQELKAHNNNATSANAFDELLPSLAESFKALTPEAQAPIVSAVAVGLGNPAKALLSARLTSLGYGVPEQWQPTTTTFTPQSRMTITTSDWINIACATVPSVVGYVLGFFHARKRPDTFVKWIKPGRRCAAPCKSPPMTGCKHGPIIQGNPTKRTHPIRRLDRDR